MSRSAKAIRRVLIPQEFRTELRLSEGTVVQLERGKKETIVVKPARRRRRLWKDLNGIEPARTGRPVWPSSEEIRSIWE